MQNAVGKLTLYFLRASDDFVDGMGEDFLILWRWRIPDIDIQLALSVDVEYISISHR